MRQEAADEYRRLLYVAMTRAIDRLVVCGAEGQRGRPEGCWWDLVFAALQPPVSVEEPADDGEGKVWRYRKVPDAARKTGPEFAAPPAHGRPPWLDRDMPAEPPPLRALSPSDAYDEATPTRAPAGGSRAERDKARARGVLMHRLLQALPDIPNAARAEAARRHLARAGSAFSADERETMLEQIRVLLDDARFAQLFLPGSRAEVPIVGRLDGGRLAVSGQVDRLALTSDSLLIADYKTNRPAPRRVEDVPPAYVTQLALYRAVLGRLFPDRPIRAALIWTDIPDLREIPAASLDAALAAVTSP
jgi:ATP-dependent helicase/nuclease subunit A